MYPLKFQPVFQRRLWGGTRLHTLLSKSLPRELEREAVGESWELADLPPGTVQADSAGAASDGSLSSVITNGPWAGKTLHDVWPQVKDARRKTNNEKYFPLLMKFLDAQQDLSVQVHPDAAYAKAHPGAHLKSEAWYIVHAEPGAKIYKGFKPGVTRDQFRAALETGHVAELLRAIPVRKGDCHFLRSGTVHALGAGILAAEVQTPSDTTFRVFDWNRLGADGKPRKLHVKEALECIDFGAAPDEKISTPAATPNATRLVECEFFSIDRVQMKQAQEMSLPAATAIWTILDGQGVLNVDGHGPTAFAPGDTLLLPATMKTPRVRTIADCAWLEAKVPG